MYTTVGFLQDYNICDAFRLEPRPPFISGHSHTETPSSMSSVSEVEELMTSLDLGENVSRPP